MVSQREGVITGMTRDGTFRIRDGKIAEPLVNLRFTVAMPDVLAELPGLTRETRLVSHSDFYDDRWAHGNRVPAIATTSFNITGAGSGPGSDQRARKASTNAFAVGTVRIDEPWPPPFTRMIALSFAAAARIR